MTFNPNVMPLMNGDLIDYRDVLCLILGNVRRKKCREICILNDAKVTCLEFYVWPPNNIELLNREQTT